MDAVDASDAADAFGVNAWDSDGIAADEDEGMTALMVGRIGWERTSSSTSNAFSW